MPNPQQPELRRSGHNAVDDAEAATRLPAEGRPGVGGDTGPVPEDNLPGHHPGEDQDKPDGDDFVAKAREVAARAREEREAEERSDGQAEGRSGATAGTPPSAAPVADVPAGGGGADTEADAPSATPSAVAAEAMDRTPAGEGVPADASATNVRSTSAPTATPTATSAAPPNPLVTIATFQWKVATFPLRVTLDVLDRIRRRL